MSSVNLNHRHSRFQPMSTETRSCSPSWKRCCRARPQGQTWRDTHPKSGVRFETSLSTLSSTGKSQKQCQYLQPVFRVPLWPYLGHMQHPQMKSHPRKSPRHLRPVGPASSLERASVSGSLSTRWKIKSVILATWDRPSSHFLLSTNQHNTVVAFIKFRSIVYHGI